MDYVAKHDISKVKPFIPSVKKNTSSQIMELIQKKDLNKIAYWMNEHNNKNPDFTLFVDPPTPGYKVINQGNVQSTFKFREINAWMIQTALEAGARDVLEFLINDPIHKDRNYIKYPQGKDEEIFQERVNKNDLEYLLKNKVWCSLGRLAEQISEFDKKMVMDVASHFANQNDIKSLKQFKSALCRDIESLNNTEPVQELIEVVDKVIKKCQLKTNLDEKLGDNIEEKLQREKENLAILEEKFLKAKENISSLEKQLDIQSKKKNTVKNKI